MGLKITDTEMTSGLTDHTARLVALPPPFVGSYSWEVTWLPGRHLDRNQAVTAMTIAESVAAMDFESPGNPQERAAWWGHVDGWAKELGVTGPFAVAEASLSRADREMTDSRRNRDGDPCPVWCTSKHGELLIKDDPSLGYMIVHRSARLGGQGGRAAVFVDQWPGRTPVIVLQSGIANIDLTARDARVLGAIMRDEGAPQLADRLADATVLVAELALQATK